VSRLEVIGVAIVAVVVATIVTVGLLAIRVDPPT